MAVVTKLMATTTDEVGAAARLEYDYDDGFSPPRMTAVRVINSSTRSGIVEVVRQADGQSFSQVFGPEQTTTRTIGTGGAQRFDVTIGIFGRIEGVELAAFMLT
jgi:hypothetical protein